MSKNVFVLRIAYCVCRGKSKVKNQSAKLVLSKVEGLQSPSVRYTHSGQASSISSVQASSDGVLVSLAFSRWQWHIAQKNAEIFLTADTPFAGTSDNAYGFTGQQQFNEADNLVFLRARYYDTRVGRFISRDPILTPMQIEGHIGWLLPYLNLVSQPQSLHPYVYVQNNPINRVDPFGLKGKSTSAWQKCIDRCEEDYSWNKKVCWAKAVLKCKPWTYVTCWWGAYVDKVVCNADCQSSI